MRRIGDHRTEYLIDPWGYMGPKRRKMLEESWAGLFRRHLLNNLPVERLAEVFDPRMGRPSKELIQMEGAVIIQAMSDRTDREMVTDLAFDAQVQYALDIAGQGDEDCYVCERTYWDYRQKMLEAGLDEEIFTRCTDELIKVFSVATDKQRIDSTHIKSNMRRLGRVRIIGETIRGFLREIKRVHAEMYGGLDISMRERHEGEGGGCFGQVRPSEAGKVLEQVAQDLGNLVEQFSQDSAVTEISSYKLMVRVLKEQCTVTEGNGPEDKEPEVKIKPPKEVSSDSLQNPSDPDAGYSGHKGQGYTAQIMETYTQEEDETALSLITHVDVTPAHVGDSGALLPAIEATSRRSCCPKEVEGDSAYGSDENKLAAAARGVELVAPTAGGNDALNGTLGLKDFVCDGATLTIHACPRGHAVAQTEVTRTGRHVSVFDREICAACPDRERCPVEITTMRACMYYNNRHIRLALRRQHEATDGFRDRYRWRAGIEGTNSRLKSQTGAGRLRVRGLEKVRFSIRLRALGLNILRAVRTYAARMRRLEQITAILRPVRVFFHMITSIRTNLNQLSPVFGRKRLLVWNVAA